MDVKSRGNSVSDLRNEAGSTASRALSDFDIEPEILLNVPIQARALAKLSLRERARYQRARKLLAKGSVQALPQAGICVSGRGVYEALLAQSWSIRFDDPNEMVRLAEIALDVSRRLTSSARWVADLQTRAWGELANAFRTADRLRMAQLAFGEAYTLFAIGTGDPYLQARLFELEASLLGALREFPIAIYRLSTLSNLYLGINEIHLSGRALITNALYTFYSGNAEEALEINKKGISLIDKSQDSDLFMHALHNHLLFLVDLKLYPEAQKLLFLNRRNLIYKERINALRFRGLEGRIDYGLGNLISAEIAFREAKEGLAEAGMSFLAAILSLDHAMALKSLNRTDEALEEVTAAREIFLSLEVYREYLGSVIFLEESLRRGEATTELVEATVALINRKWVQTGPRDSR